MYRSRSAGFWPSCCTARWTWVASLSTAAGRRPVKPSASRPASVKAVALLSCGLRSRPIPRFAAEDWGAVMQRTPLLSSSIEDIGMDDVHEKVVVPVVHRDTDYHGPLHREGPPERGR